MSTRETVLRYYAGISQKSEWHYLISDNIMFSGTGLKSTTGRDNYIQAINNFLQSVKTSKVKEMIVDGKKACAVVRYDMVSPKGKNISFDVAEILVVKNEKIESSDIFFDTTAFAAFMAD
jgi:ketosteroid isomerase-like protein